MSARGGNELAERAIGLPHAKHLVTRFSQYLIPLPAGDLFGPVAEEGDPPPPVEGHDPFDNRLQEVIGPVLFPTQFSQGELEVHPGPFQSLTKCGHFPHRRINRQGTRELPCLHRARGLGQIGQGTADPAGPHRPDERSQDDNDQDAGR